MNFTDLSNLNWFAARRFSRRVALRGGVGLAGLAAVGLTRVPVSAASAPPAAAGNFAGRVSIGSRSLYLVASGHGSPSVVLEAGAGADSDVWNRDYKEPVGMRTMVQPGVAAFTHVWAYDRPGTIGEVNPDLEPEPDPPLFLPSRSDPVPQPRTPKAIVADLHALLGAAKVPAPYVLVGHSAGGLMVRLYASTYPDEVVGMVLIDSTHEDTWSRFKQALTPSQWTTFEALTVHNKELEAAYPAAERLWTAPLVDAPFVVQVQQAQREAPLRPMPLYVLTHGLPFDAPFPGWPSATMEKIMQDLQDDLARLVPNAKHVIATKSGHNIHQDQPDLVIAAIKQVVAAVHDPSTWTK